MMFRLLAAMGVLLFAASSTTTARADSGFLAANPALDAEQPVMALRLLDGYRANADSVIPRRVKLPKSAVAPEREQPGEALTTYVERVWSQARVYRRPGGAELILRTKF
jgi:hypothetical protein